MASRNADRPNVLFIMTDDQGPWALGCAGNQEIITPNLDKLAGEGVRFDHYFCSSPVCSPARATVLTGLIPSQHGVHDFLRDADNAKLTYVNRPAYTQLLAEQGYVCGISGKWGVGNDYEPQQGFSHWYVCMYDAGHYWDPPMVRNGEVLREQGYLTDLITADALHFLEEQADTEQPFYLSVNYTAPHHLWVNEHPQRFLDLYKNCSFESCPQEAEHPWFLPLTNPATVRTDPIANLQGYFASVTAMDEGVGFLMDKLEQIGLRGNTLICFMSDNGFSCGHKGIWGKGNGTYPQNMYDNSVKVPAIFCHPGRIPGGRVDHSLLSQYDFMPTLLDYLGVPLPEAIGADLPGRSFKPVLEGRFEDSREHVVVYDEYGPVRMIRTREFKYVHRYPFGPFEFYDMIRDPEERCNLYEHPHYQDRIAELQGRLEGWFLQYASPGMDGSRLPVTGTGQSKLVGPGLMDRRTFNQNGRIAKQT
jgi:choline-sulfatase